MNPIVATCGSKWCTFVIPALGKLRLEDCEYVAKLKPQRKPYPSSLDTISHITPTTICHNLMQQYLFPETLITYEMTLHLQGHHIPNQTTLFTQNTSNHVISTIQKLSMPLDYAFKSPGSHLQYCKELKREREPQIYVKSVDRDVKKVEHLSTYKIYFSKHLGNVLEMLDKTSGKEEKVKQN